MNRYEHLQPAFARRSRCASLMLLAAACVAAAAGAAQDQLATFRVENGEIPAPLISTAADAGRGRVTATSREGANCQLCHALPGIVEPFSGNLAPPLAGVGARFTAGALRLRIVDAALFNRDTIMPAYYRVQGLRQVAAAYSGKPILTAQQVEDVVAYLQTLR